MRPIGDLFLSMFKLLYSSNHGTAMSGISAYPASGSYVDVSGFERVHVLVHWGVIHDSDTPVLTLKCSDSVSGTLDTVDSDLAVTPTPASDDNKHTIFTVEVESLPTDHHFLALAVSGTVSNGTYVNVEMWGEGAAEPPTQTTAKFTTVQQYDFVGGDAYTAP